MNTPALQGIEKQTIIAPKDGWKEGVYIVEVAWSKDNMIHRAVLWLGTTNKKPSKSFMEQFADHAEVRMWKREPAAAKLLSVHNWIHGQYEDPIKLDRNLPYFLKPVLQISGIDLMDGQLMDVMFMRWEDSEHYLDGMLNITMRTYRILQKLSVNTVEDARAITWDQFRNVQGAGRTCWEDLQDALKQFDRHVYKFEPSNLIKP